MNTTKLQEIGEALYGPRWQSELARAMSISDRYMRKLLAGEAPVSDHWLTIITKIAKQRLKEVERAVKHLEREGQ